MNSVSKLTITITNFNNNNGFFAVFNKTTNTTKKKSEAITKQITKQSQKPITLKH